MSLLCSWIAVLRFVVAETAAEHDAFCTFKIVAARSVAGIYEWMCGFFDRESSITCVLGIFSNWINVVTTSRCTARKGRETVSCLRLK